MCGFLAVSDCRGVQWPSDVELQHEVYSSGAIESYSNTIVSVVNIPTKNFKSMPDALIDLFRLDNNKR